MNQVKPVHIGICDPYLQTKGGGEKCAIATAEVLAGLPNTRVSLLVYDDPVEINKQDLESYFQADLSRVEIVRVEQDRKLVERYTKYHKRLPLMIRSFFAAYIEYRAFRAHDLDVFINNFYKSNIFNPAPVGVYFCMFPQKLAPPTPAISGYAQRAYRKLIAVFKRKMKMEIEPSKMLSTYQSIISISQFTQKWVQKYWARDSDIVYPICEDMHVPGIKKEKIILNVGRFFATGDDKHHKKQDVLLDAFMEMEDLHATGWELHFAGGIARDTEAMEFALKLVMKARNYPVYFHFGAPFDELQKLYNQAQVYWHATGFGLDENKYPDQQEHFGITSVEAMSAGAIPVVLNAAGQRDTIVDGTAGFLWNSLEELQARTRQLAKMPDKELEALRKNAVNQAKKFDKKTYQHEMKKIIARAAEAKGYHLGE